MIARVGRFIGRTVTTVIVAVVAAVAVAVALGLTLLALGLITVVVGARLVWDRVTGAEPWTAPAPLAQWVHEPVGEMVDIHCPDTVDGLHALWQSQPDQY